MDKLPISVPVRVEVDGETYEARIQHTIGLGKARKLKLNIGARDRRKAKQKPFPISIELEDTAGAFPLFGRAVAYLGKGSK